MQAALDWRRERRREGRREGRRAGGKEDCTSWELKMLRLLAEALEENMSMFTPGRLSLEVGTEGGREGGRQGGSRMSSAHVLASPCPHLVPFRPLSSLPPSLPPSLSPA
jgi:hypothetical protein